MKLLGKFLLSLATISASIALGFLNAYVVIDIAKLYNVSFITEATFAQVFGVLLIFSLSIIKPKDLDITKVKNKEEDALTIAEPALNKLVIILFAWGMAYFSHLFI